MAYLNTTTAHSTIFARLADTVEAAATRYKQYRLFRATFNELNALSNRELADLGLHRSELGRIATESAYN